MAAQINGQLALRPQQGPVGLADQAPQPARYPAGADLEQSSTPWARRSIDWPSFFVGAASAVALRRSYRMRAFRPATGTCRTDWRPIWNTGRFRRSPRGPLRLVARGAAPTITRTTTPTTTRSFGSRGEQEARRVCQSVGKRKTDKLVRAVRQGSGRNLDELMRHLEAVDKGEQWRVGCGRRAPCTHGRRSPAILQQLWWVFADHEYMVPVDHTLRFRR